MSQENVEIVGKAIEAWNQREADLLLSYAAPEIEWMPAGLAAVAWTGQNAREREPCCARPGVRGSLGAARRQVDKNPSLSLVARRPQSRGAGGVGDVAGERGGREAQSAGLAARRLRGVPVENTP